MRATARFVLVSAVAVAAALPFSSPAQAAPPAPGIEDSGPTANLSDKDKSVYLKAFKAAEKRRWSNARRAGAKANNPLPAKIIDWLYYREPQNRASFGEISGFIDANPHWPELRRLQKRAEEALSDRVPDEQLLAWYVGRQPLSPDGRIRLAEAMIRSGMPDVGEEWLRYSWINDNLPQSLSRHVYQRHKARLSAEDHIARVDRLLWDGRRQTANRLLFLLPQDQRLLAKARMSLMARAGGVDDYIAQVPPHLKDHPGLAYERTRWRRRKGLDDRARDILLGLADNIGPRPERWWTERRIQVREMLARGETRTAYRLASEHGLVPGGAPYAEAEWLSGWIALRFIAEPDRAYAHFSSLYYNVKFPVSLSRAAYWAGRAATALDQAEKAAQWYRAAAQNPTTYYGQLAIEVLGETELADSLPADPIPTARQLAAFNGLELVRATRMLSELGQKRHLRPFIVHLADSTGTPAERHLVGRLAEDLGQPHLSVRAAKRASRDGVTLIDVAYPVIELPEVGPEKALLLAISRQESEFNPRAVSPAGARGLMQLMPRTARSEAKSLRLPYKRSKLTRDPVYNIRLGAAHLNRLLRAYDGSYVMAVAAYNAGSSRVRRWIRDFGDPRRPEVDTIDWIEQIPIAETRNYVQRVLESLQVYRHRLSEAPVQLSLFADLNRTALQKPGT